MARTGRALIGHGAARVRTASDGRHGPSQTMSVEAPARRLGAARVAIVHDYLTQRGGAERVVLSMLKAFPDAPVYTSLFDAESTFPEFSDADVRTVLINRIGLLRRHHRWALPLLAPTFSRLRVDADVVICSSSGWAHGAKVTGCKIVYCHSPAKWLYRAQDYMGTSSAGHSLVRLVRHSLMRLAVAALGRCLRWWDRRAAASAYRYLANSAAIRDQIESAYSIDADVLPAPNILDPDGPVEPIDGIEPGFFLTVSRLLSYKNVDAVASAFNDLPNQGLIVVGVGPEASRLEALAPPNVRFVGSVSDEGLRWLYANSCGLISAAYEDYGLTPLEAASFGKPVAVFRGGGFLDTVAEGRTGVFFDEATPLAIQTAALKLLSKAWDNDLIMSHAETYSESAFIERLQSVVADASAELSVESRHAVESPAVPAMVEMHRSPQRALPPPLPPELAPTNGGVDSPEVGSRTTGWLTSDLPDDRTIERHSRRRGVLDRGWLVRRALLAADVVALLFAFSIVEALSAVSTRVSVDRYSALHELGLFLVTIPFWVVAAKLYGLYDRDEERADATTADDLIGVLHVLTVGTWLVFAFASLSGLAHPHVAKFVLFWGFAILLMTLARAGARAFCRRQSAYLQNTLIVGAGDVGQLLVVKLLQHPEYGINVLGFVDADPKEPREEIANIPILGTIDDLPELIRSLGVERVIIAFSGDTHEQTLNVMRMLNEFDLRVDIVPRLFEHVPPSANIHMLEGVTLIGLPRPRLGRSSLLLKRAMDLVVTVPMLVLLAPVLLAIAVLIKLDSRGPALFRQVRMGSGGKQFVIFKFRTMAADAEERKQDIAHLSKHARQGGDPRMFKIPDDPRLTRVGRILRRYSLDELPQLLNVLRGEMSLVGPRPLILEEHRFLDTWGLRRLDLKPGITGLWQVLGRDAIPFEEMVRLDYFYVTTWSLWNDIRLLLQTFAILGRGERSLFPARVEAEL
jgi:exopolysaccharide biosynthesis polyprenyl glycosylphosphotransferase